MKTNITEPRKNRAQRGFTFIATALASLVLGIVLITMFRDLRATHLMIKQTETRSFYVCH